MISPTINDKNFFGYCDLGRPRSFVTKINPKNSGNFATWNSVLVFALMNGSKVFNYSE